MSQPSPQVPRPNRPAWSPTTTTATSAAAADAAAGAMAPRSSPVTAQPDAKVTTAVSSSVRKASSTVASMPSAVSGWFASTWLAKGVAGEQCGRTIGVRADHGHSRRRPQREGPVVGQQDDGLLGELRRDGAVLRRVQWWRHDGFAVERLVEQSEIGLLGEHAQDGLVHQRLVQGTAARRASFQTDASGRVGGFERSSQHC